MKSVTSRPLVAEDEELLKASIALDIHHKLTSEAFFVQPGTVTSVFENEEKPICFARLAKSLRVDIQFINNDDKRSNARVLSEGLGPMCAQAKENGFTEIVFSTSNPELSYYCQRLGFEVVPDTFVLRKLL